MKRFELVLAIVTDDEDQLAELLAEAVADFAEKRSEASERHKAEVGGGFEWRIYDHQRRINLPPDLR